MTKTKLMTYLYDYRKMCTRIAFAEQKSVWTGGQVLLQGRSLVLLKLQICPWRTDHRSARRSGRLWC